MPTLRRPSRGSRVITAGSVMNGPASPGQQVWTGSRVRDRPRRRAARSPGRRPCAQCRGGESAIDFSCFKPAQLVREAVRRLHLEHVGELRRHVVEPLDAEGEAHAALRPELVDEQRVLASLRRARRAAPGRPARTVRSTISVTSRCGSTSASTRTSSPSRSSSAIHSRRSSGQDGARRPLGLPARATAPLTDARSPQRDELDDARSRPGRPKPDEQHREDDRACRRRDRVEDHSRL